MRAPRPIADVSQLKALTHPLRVRILYALRAEGSATASRLGQVVDESPNSVSYHLRKLADAGFAFEAPELGVDGRERWWRVPVEGFSWSSADFAGTVDGAATSRAAKQVLVENQFLRQREYDDTAESWGEDWIRAAHSADFVLRLSPDETEEMMREAQEVFAKWRELSDSRDGSKIDGAEHVMVFAHGFPFRP
ncbi:helix-turn-helix domain-containing protein [Rhodococcus sp. G-MC3]|uniref:ArsR/SmtB family transcription factor n=1 Tax=Rhodococcus sp. G-MC3 TaxID=3046209 RepID=UPI0024BA86A7|nr:helix-turn-helix domain-containing protein [Rhodococcus sp. G-MC3]MDJ0394082.1 helix-turn-helix domain-containing protein [Rhodococcus sp. G-MC3]